MLRAPCVLKDFSPREIKAGARHALRASFVHHISSHSPVQAVRFRWVGSETAQNALLDISQAQGHRLARHVPPDITVQVSVMERRAVHCRARQVCFQKQGRRPVLLAMPGSSQRGMRVHALFALQASTANQVLEYCHVLQEHFAQ